MAKYNKYNLVGQDGNEFSLMGYTSNALKREGLGHLVKEMTEKAMSKDYNYLIAVCDEYVQMANKAYAEKHPDEDEDDE